MRSLLASSAFSADDDLQSPDKLAVALREPQGFSEKIRRVLAIFSKDSQRSMPGLHHVKAPRKPLQAIRQRGDEVAAWIKANPNELGDQQGAWEKAIDAYQVAVGETEAYAAQVSGYKAAREAALKGRLLELNKGCVAAMMKFAGTKIFILALGGLLGSIGESAPNRTWGAA